MVRNIDDKQLKKSHYFQSYYPLSAIEEIKAEISGLGLYRWPDDPAPTTPPKGAVDLGVELAKTSCAPLSSDGPVVRGSPRDKLIYIYTSGTTGMPKAAVFTNLR